MEERVTCLCTNSTKIGSLELTFGPPVCGMGLKPTSTCSAVSGTSDSSLDLLSDEPEQTAPTCICPVRIREICSVLRLQSSFVITQEIKTLFVFSWHSNSFLRGQQWVTVAWSSRGRTRVLQLWSVPVKMRCHMLLRHSLNFWLMLRKLACPSLSQQRTWAAPWTTADQTGLSPFNKTKTSHAVKSENISWLHWSMKWKTFRQTQCWVMIAGNVRTTKATVINIHLKVPFIRWT